MARLCGWWLLVTISVSMPYAQEAPARRPLSSADINDIAVLLKLEDTRQFDEAALTRLLASPRPEVRRRAVMSVGRIASDRGRELLAGLRGEKDPEMLATVAFATGQVKDPDAVAWLGGLLNNSASPAAVAREAAQALGKIRTPDARTSLARYLNGASTVTAPPQVAGEALLSIGRFTTREDLAPILRWTSSPNVGVRWRAAWALFRPRDPAAVPHLLKMSTDPSPDVRFWAVRGLAPDVVDASGVSRTDTSARLRQAVHDPDRRVRTEAVRALVQYDDDASFGVVMDELNSRDTWLSVSVAEALGRFRNRAAVVVPALVAASAAGNPTSVRISALAPLAVLAPDAARTLAEALAKDSSVVAQTSAAQVLRRLDTAASRPAQGQPAAPTGRGNARPPVIARSDAEYRALVERWIVPDYDGAPKPHVVIDTTRGQIEIELYPGDAPLGVDYLMKVVESGAIANTEFGRVVPNFVAQQRAIRNDMTLRDEVNRHGLVRGNLSWASAGLDTGRPGYTLGSTPQPHNEGDFTALGRVVRGLNVVDRLELGDRIIKARWK